jgi:hypothetical protein
MDIKIIFVKTSKGEDESKKITNHLPSDIKRALGLIDNQSTVKELMKRAAPSLRESLDDMLQELIDGGFIQDKDKVSSVVKMAIPRRPIQKIVIPLPKVEGLGERQDSIRVMQVSAAEALAAEEDYAEQEAALARAKVAAEKAHIKVEQEAEIIRVELEVAQARAKVEAEAKARADAETFHIKAEQEAARIRAEQEAAQAPTKAAAETARIKAEQEAEKIRAELEVAQAMAKAEAKALADAEASRLKVELEATRIRAEQEAAQTREKMEMAAKVRAKAEESRIIEEQDSIKVKAKHLATLLAMEKAEAKTRDEAAARIKAEQAAAKIRVDQEAAQTVAKAKMKAAVKIQAAQVPEMKAVRRVAKTRSKPLPWGKIATGLILLPLLMVVLLPFVWPMQSYVTQIEQKLSGQLQHPVHVGHLRARLLPQPKLELEDVSFGVTQELKASSVVLNFNFFELLSDIKSIRSLEINDLILNAKSFDKALPWLQIAGGDTHYPVASMVLQRARVSDDELVLPSVNGVVNFDGQRRFAKAVLKSVDGKLSLELQPQKSHWQIALAIKGSYVPLLPNILFNELTAKGELGAGEIKFHEIEGSLYGGLLTGSAYLTWLNGWQMQGLVDVKAMKLLDALPQSGIAGEMDGHANFILRSEKLSLLARTPHLDGKFLIKKGLINKIDMVETSRMPNRKGVSSGHTHFDALSGMLQINNNSLHLRQIKISNSVMSANGYADVAANKQLSGRLNVNLKVRADLGSVPLVLSGTLTEPLWSTGR